MTTPLLVHSEMFTDVNKDGRQALSRSGQWAVSVWLADQLACIVLHIAVKFFRHHMDCTSEQDLRVRVYSFLPSTPLNLYGSLEISRNRNLGTPCPWQHHHTSWNNRGVLANHGPCLPMVSGRLGVMSDHRTGCYINHCIQIKAGNSILFSYDIPQLNSPYSPASRHSIWSLLSFDFPA
jgi:hypothetical protein